LSDIIGVLVIGVGFVCTLTPSFAGIECGNRAWVALISPTQRARAIKMFMLAALVAAGSVLALVLLPLPVTETSLPGFASASFGLGVIAGFAGRYLNRPK